MGEGGALAAIVLDGLVAIGLAWMALRALNTRRMVEAVIVFVGFSGLMAVAWLRLHAPDLALAEAAIGAGVTGVLLLDNLGRIAARLPGNRDD